MLLSSERGDMLNGGQPSNTLRSETLSTAQRQETRQEVYSMTILSCVMVCGVKKEGNIENERGEEQK